VHTVEATEDFGTIVPFLRPLDAGHLPASHFNAWRIMAHRPHFLSHKHPAAAHFGTAAVPVPVPPLWSNCTRLEATGTLRPLRPDPLR
jgi:hypothetical protein